MQVITVRRRAQLYPLAFDWIAFLLGGEGQRYVEAIAKGAVNINKNSVDNIK